MVSNRLFQITSETRTVEIDDSIVRECTSDTETDQENYTKVYDDVCRRLTRLYGLITVCTDFARVDAPSL
jgi:hypothetical protein